MISVPDTGFPLTRTASVEGGPSTPGAAGAGTATGAGAKAASGGGAGNMTETVDPASTFGETPAQPTSWPDKISEAKLARSDAHNPP